MRVELGLRFIPKLSGFQCQRCGKCCTTLDRATVKSKHLRYMCHYLGMKRGEFLRKYCTVENGRVYVNQPCPFYSEGCRIYRYRPQSCRDFPVVGVDSRGNVSLNMNCPQIEALQKEGYEGRSTQEVRQGAHPVVSPRFMQD